MNRAEFCHRLMPALKLAAGNGYLRNDPITRRLLGYAAGDVGSRAFGHQLVHWARQGLFKAEDNGGKRFTYRITPAGRQSIIKGQPVVRRRPWPQSKLRDYLEAHPDEELTPRDVAIKFGTSLQTAQKAISRLVSAGVAVRVNAVRLAPRPILKAA